MKCSPAMPIVCLALAAVGAAAREPSAPPSPSDSAPQVGSIKAVSRPNGYGAATIFVGHFGETIEFPYDWTVQAEMRGLTEIVYFNPKFTDASKNQEFLPKRSDFEVENFSPKELMELVVIPKKAPGSLPNLKAIRVSKAAELAKSGVEHAISDETNPYVWPPGTFNVAVSRPYRLRQTYGETSGEYYILTTGDYLEKGDYGLSEERIDDYNLATDRARVTFQEYLFTSHKNTLGANLFTPAPETEKGFLSGFKTVRFAAIYGSLAGAMLLFAFWPGSTARARHVRLFGKSLFVFAHLTGFAGFLTTYLPIVLGDVAWRCGGDATLIPVLAVPAISWLAARRLGSAHARRVLVTTGVLAVLWMFVGLIDRRPDVFPAEFAVSGNAMLLHFLGMIFGVAFALSIGQIQSKGGAR